MSQLTLLDHLKFGAERAKAFSGKLASDLANAVADAVGEVAGRLTSHADDAAAHVSKEDREKWNQGRGSSGFDYQVIATRKRDSAKPDFGLSDQPAMSAALEVGTYTGNTPIGAVINGVEYDAGNLYLNENDAPDGALILNPDK